MKLGLPWTKWSKKRSARSAPDDDGDAASVHERHEDPARQLERISRITAGRMRTSEPAAASDGHPPRPIYADAGFDEALAEIAARQRTLEGESRDLEQRRAGGHPPATPSSQNLSGLDEQLRKITTQIESLRRPSEAEDAIPALRQELSEISRSLAEAMPRRAIEALEAEVRGLAERLDQSKQSGVDTAALANLELGLAEVRQALATLKPAESLVDFQSAIQQLSRKIDGIVAHQQDPAVLQQLESAITGLRSIVAHVASDDTLARLTEEVRGIAVRLERSGGTAGTPDSLANIERQICLIAEALDRDQAPAHQAPANLEATLRGLAEKVEKLQPNRSDTIAFGQLEDRIAKLVEKLDASGSRFNHLEAIERGLADVLVYLEEQRARLRATGHDPLVESFKREFDAVNGTLNRLVDRLATIETGIRSGGQLAAAVTFTAAPAQPSGREPPPAAASPPSVAAPAPTASPSPATALVVPIKAPAPASSAPTTAAKPVAPPSERLAAAAQAQRPAAARERSPIDPSLPPDHPLEPGAAHTRPGQTPADRIADSEAALGPAKPPIAPNPSSQTDFVAAARRAAQAALRQPAESAHRDADTGPDAAKASLRQRVTGRIRSLLVGASVVILAIGASCIGMMLLDADTADAPVTKPAVQAPVISAPTKSTERISPDQAPTGSTQRTGGPSADDAGRAEPSAEDSINATPPVPGAQQADVTGSIPAATLSPDEPPAVPLPPNRPAAEETVIGPKSRLVAAATAGDPAAAYELAGRHLEGRGVRQSYEEGTQWLTRASKAGLAPAQFRLGSLYEKGIGLKKNLTEAHRLYSAAAAQGNAKAMHNLAVLYAEGFKGKPDYETAVGWFRKAADRGVPDSQYNLGVLYARGVGVEQNLAESYKWFALAARLGDKDSASKREEIGARLDAESLMAAKLAVNTWTMQPQPPEATTVKSPPGGWDVEQPPVVSTKRRPRTNTPLKLGPG